MIKKTIITVLLLFVMIIPKVYAADNSIEVDPETYDKPIKAAVTVTAVIAEDGDESEPQEPPQEPQTPPITSPSKPPENNNDDDDDDNNDEKETTYVVQEKPVIIENTVYGDVAIPQTNDVSLLENYLRLLKKEKKCQEN